MTPVSKLPPVSTTQAANIHRYQQHMRQILPPVPLVLLTSVINHTSGKFVTGVIDTGGK
jgi:hypothetical protein